MLDFSSFLEKLPLDKESQILDSFQKTFPNLAATPKVIFNTAMQNYIEEIVKSDLKEEAQKKVPDPVFKISDVQSVDSKH